MKKILLVSLFSMTVCFFIEDTICTTSKEEKEKFEKRKSILDKSIKRISLQGRKIHLEAQECHLSNKRDSCLALENSKKELAQETIEFYDEFGFDIYMGRYTFMYINRQELYYADKKILDQYKEKLPQDIYENLEEFEDRLNYERIRLIEEGGMLIFDQNTPIDLSLEKIDDLKKNDPEAYKAIINYFAESAVERRANTKKVAFDTKEKYEAFMLRGFEKRSEKEQKMIKIYLSALKKEDPETWEVNRLTLAEVYKRLNESK